ncbi:MAG: CapA family protein [Deltaproteobacteria bacterium]|nr:CapA family protein [Deltaproteobacteria bacterium]MBN2672395.1 CapA family protein [Deltaproteobacteria bacterium]
MYPLPFRSLISVIIIFLIAAPISAQTVTFSAVGDIFFGRGGRQFGTENPFRYVSGELKGRDIVLGNLESPICESRARVLEEPCSLKKGTCDTPEKKRYRRLFFLTFQARISAARMLRGAGFTVVSTANNHAEDQGGPGILETLEHLKQQNVSAVGSGPTKADAWQPVIIEKNKIRVGIIAATTILNFTPVEKSGFVAHGTLKRLRSILPQRISELKEHVDFVVVTLHYGAEDSSHPSYREQQLVADMVQAGMDVFIGTHPHVLQGVQVTEKAVIFWSLGNFLFDSRKDSWRESGIVHLDFHKDGAQKRIENIRFVPVTLSGDPQRLPIIANEWRAPKIIDLIQDRSRRFRNPQTSFSVENNQLHIRMGSDPAF